MASNYQEPCAQCPFARHCKGYLGPYKTTDELVDLVTRDEAFFPCHMSMKKRPDKHCTGALVFMNQSCKLSRDPKIALLQKIAPKTHPKVFRNRIEMKEYHEG